MFSIRNQLVFGTCIFVLALVLMPYTIHLNIPHIDKMGHLGAFAMMTIAVAQIFTIRKSVLIVLLLSTISEYTQTFIPTREASFGDILANCTGIISVWIFYSKITLVNLMRRKT